MSLRKIRYRDLNSPQRQIFNFQKVAGQLAEYGFNCIKLADDWQGADFLAYHKDGSSTLKVQLKSRVSIAKKYMRKSLHVAFPVGRAWYLIKHDKLVDLVGRHTPWLNSSSWRDRGGYSSGKPNEKLLAALVRFKL
jgi:hypothetical protein